MKTSDVGKNTSFWNKKFHYAEMGSSLKTEIIAGLTTFLAMAYILVVNSGMFAALGSVSFDAMYVTTAGFYQTCRLRRLPEWGLMRSLSTRFV